MILLLSLCWCAVALNVQAPHEVIIQLRAGVTPEVFAQRHGLQYMGALDFLPESDRYFRFLENTDTHTTTRVARDTDVHWIERQVPRVQHKRGAGASDPLYTRQWHLGPIQAPEAWEAGYTGTGVTVGIVDDGLQWQHGDLRQNYATALSHDYNEGDSDPSPHPGDNHGTCCAGVAAAVANNTHCGAGVAPGARVAGVRLIGGPTTDLLEAAALSHRARSGIDIFSNSWGPADDGMRMVGPGRLTRAALAHNVQTGRGGLGSIYVWAAGNGGHVGDSCAFDGYASSPYTIAVGAMDSNHRQAYYSEGCAALMCIAPSSGKNTKGITTVDVNIAGQGYAPTSECTSSFGGTSSACPTVAGVIALVLQANPALTWRDVQLLIAKTSRAIETSDASWSTNSRGYRHSERFGFGIVQARTLVETARQWQRVSTQHGHGSGVLHPRLVIPNDGGTTSACVQHTFSASRITFVEHVLVRIGLRHPRRGHLRIQLRSPELVVSTLANVHGDTHANYPARDGWLFTSVRHFGEHSANGAWQLCITDVVRDTRANHGLFEFWELAVFGH